MRSLVLQHGFGLVEIVVVAGIVSTVFVGMFQLVILATRPIASSTREAEATYLAEEALEAVRALRNENWTDNITPLSNGTTYYPTLISNRWTLSTTNTGPVQGLYAQTVVLGAAYRDGNDNISPTGTLDENTKKVTATVTWTEHGQTKNVTLETYITNFFAT
ncbi:MAG: type IV pilus modification PilV family protein [Candidatus Binatia bacterium]